MDEYRTLLKIAHNKHQELSIESQLVTSSDVEDDTIVIGARVTTAQGGFNGWAEGAKRRINDVEEQAVMSALLKANITLDTPMFDAQTVEDATPEYPTSEEMLSSLFKGDESEAEAEEDTSEPITCEGTECPNGGKVVKYYAGTITLSAADVAKRTSARHGKTLCADCSSAAILKRKRKS